MQEVSTKWRKRSEAWWQLWLQGKRRRVLAHLRLVEHGWLVDIHSGEQAGPYGDFDLARQSAEKRIWRMTQTVS